MPAGAAAADVATAEVARQPGEPRVVAVASPEFGARGSVRNGRESFPRATVLYDTFCDTMHWALWAIVHRSRGVLVPQLSNLSFGPKLPETPSSRSLQHGLVMYISG